MLTVIIVSWNVRDLLHGCLRSLEPDLPSPPRSAPFPPEEGRTRIIVIDSASTDGSPDMVRAEFPQVELIASPDNIGYVKGNNLALAQNGGGYLKIPHSYTLHSPLCLAAQPRHGRSPRRNPNPH